MAVKLAAMIRLLSVSGANQRAGALSLSGAVVRITVAVLLLSDITILFDGGYSVAMGEYCKTTGENGLLQVDTVKRRSKPFAAGGYQNKASGHSSSVLGGTENTASGYNSSVLGGYQSTASSSSSCSIMGAKQQSC